MPMKQFFVILLLVIGAMSLAIPPPDVSTSTAFADDITGAEHGITQKQKFEPGMVHLTVWRDHQKTADFCQHNYSF